MKKEKVKRVIDWLTPKEVKDIYKFLGLANYYWQFTKDFTSIARLLHNLVIVKKDQRWDWTKRQEKVFKELKEIYKRTGIHSTRLRQKNKNKS